MIRNDITLLSTPNATMNLIRFATSTDSVGHTVPARLQGEIAIAIVAIVRRIATITTTNKATLRWAETACRTSTKFVCISIATMAGPATINVHNPFGVVSVIRSEEHTTELQSHSFISYAVF